VSREISEWCRLAIRREVNDILCHFFNLSLTTVIYSQGGNPFGVSNSELQLQYAEQMQNLVSQLSGYRWYIHDNFKRRGKGMRRNNGGKFVADGCTMKDEGCWLLYTWVAYEHDCQ